MFSSDKNLNNAMNSLNHDFAIVSNWFYRNFKVINPVKCSLCYLALKLNFQADLYLVEITKKKKYWELFLIAKFSKHLTNITSKRQI